MWKENSRTRVEAAAAAAAQQRICHINICLYIFYWINIYTKHWRFLVKISNLYIHFIYIFPFACKRGQRSLCLRPLWGFVCVAPALPSSLPLLSLFSVRFCCRLFATVVFPFWQLARFVYLCLFKSNAEPAWLGLAWLALAWLCWPF